MHVNFNAERLQHFARATETAAADLHLYPLFYVVSTSSPTNIVQDRGIFLKSYIYC